MARYKCRPAHANDDGGQDKCLGQGIAAYPDNGGIGRFQAIVGAGAEQEQIDGIGQDNQADDRANNAAAQHLEDGNAEQKAQWLKR